MQALVRYFQQSANEIRKVTWPNRRQAVRLTLAVVVFSASLAIIIGLIDLALTKALERIIF